MRFDYSLVKVEGFGPMSMSLGQLSAEAGTGLSLAAQLNPPSNSLNNGSCTY